MTGTCLKPFYPLRVGVRNHTCSYDCRFLEATVTALGEGQPAPVRISAVRAVYFFCDNLIANSQTALLSPALPAMYESVMSIAQSYGSEVLGLSLDSMEHLLKVRDPFVLVGELIKKNGDN